MTSTFGAASLSSVDASGASSSARVRGSCAAEVAESLAMGIADIIGENAPHPDMASCGKRQLQRSTRMSVLEIERKDQVMVLRINRPDRMGALSMELRTALADAWCEF